VGKKAHPSNGPATPQSSTDPNSARISCFDCDQKEREMKGGKTVVKGPAPGGEGRGGDQYAAHLSLRFFHTEKRGR